ncbi:MAG TPA: hypothetical protein VN818_02385 [Gammaproteobacteria bacterium]|nr:hypothetical protein [Gammaproteobacteria bacterium]
MQNLVAPNRPSEAGGFRNRNRPVGDRADSMITRRDDELMARR